MFVATFHWFIYFFLVGRLCIVVEDELDYFFSHDWETSRLLKWLSLLVMFNSHAAAIAMLIAAQLKKKHRGDAGLHIGRPGHPVWDIQTFNGNLLKLLWLFVGWLLWTFHKLVTCPDGCQTDVRSRCCWWFQLAMEATGSAITPCKAFLFASMPWFCVNDSYLWTGEMRYLSYFYRLSS